MRSNLISKELSDDTSAAEYKSFLNINLNTILLILVLACLNIIPFANYVMEKYATLFPSLVYFSFIYFNCFFSKYCDVLSISIFSCFRVFI